MNTVIDAGVMIGFLKSTDPHHKDATEAIAIIADAGDGLLLSSVTLAEVLVGPSRAGESAVSAVLDEIRQIGAVAVVPATETSARLAARARADHPRLGTPDAMVVAAARENRAGRILTTDSDFRNVQGAVRLRDFVKSRKTVSRPKPSS